MEVAASTIGNAILSSFVEGMLEKMGSIIDWKKYAFEENIYEEIKKWKKQLKKIYAVIDDAEEKQWGNQLVEMWVCDLRDLAYDVEDILDELATEARRRKLVAAVAETRKIRRLISTVKFSAEMDSKIKSIAVRFREIFKDGEDLHLGGVNNGKERLPTTSMLPVGETKIYGRDDDKEKIIELLKAQVPSENVLIISIVGMGGLGKTTLAQLVFNDPVLEFDFKSWVSVGEDFDVFKITKQILQPDDRDEKKDLNWHQMKLKEKLDQKKCFIVLDDVWNKSYDKWTLFCGPFQGCASAMGTRILVTTRDQSVSSMMGAISVYFLKGLSQNDCLLVLAQHALGVVDFANHMDLEDIGKGIANRCRGLPLAAKALGGLLRGRPNRYDWEKVLNSNIWDLPDDCSILPALRLSYFHLPFHLKQCFAYCATFPKQFEFDRKELALLWMAEGFVAPPEENMLQLGCQYFDDLLSRSFFQVSSNDKFQYVMHDLIHELAQSVSGKTCFHLADKQKYSNLVRYSSFISGYYDTWEKFKDLSEMKNLRTFLALPIRESYCCNYLTSKVLHDMVPKLRSLRVLSLSGYNIVDLPSYIGMLNHLRYLNLSGTHIERLPESFLDLLNLQTLILRGCSELIDLPLGISNLINLQCLDISECQKLAKLPVGISNLTNLQCLDVSGTGLQEMPPRIGNLKNLHTLTKFIVGKDDVRKLTELKKLSKLQGKLHIADIQNVVDILDAEYAHLKAKHDIKELQLQWSYVSNDYRSPSDEMVLNSLQPHQNLSSLYIIGFSGARFPLWIGDSTSINLAKLKLWYCSNITSLPPLGQLPSLRELSIKGMDGVKKVGVELYGDGLCFASLETLCIEQMWSWEQWSFSIDLNEEDAVRFPKLVDLRVIDCPKLVGRLPRCLPSLQRLVVSKCHKAVLKNVSHLSSLTYLEVWEISGLTSLDEVHMQSLAALQDLRVCCCKGLRCLWQDGTNLNKVASLKCLDIFKCEKLVSLVEGEEGQLPCDLQALRVDSCCNLEYLPNGLHQLTCLRDLTIDNCENLKSFPVKGVPYSLRQLEIRRCHGLLSLPKIITSHGAGRNQTSQLEKLLVEECQSLNYFPDGHLPDSLKILVLRKSNCPIELLVSLCTKLSSQKGFPHLTVLEIGDCENLKSLPNLNLTSLKTLVIDNCEAFQYFEGGLPPSLTNLQICNCKKLKQSIFKWELHRLTSLDLSLYGGNPFTDVFKSFPDKVGLPLPCSLTHLFISDFKNLKYISRGLLYLTSLQRLDIWSCPRLSSLPEEGLPATLEVLSIWNCPLLEQRCLKDKGDYWPIISHIPFVSVDRENL